MTRLAAFLFFALIGMGVEAFFTGFSTVVERFLRKIALLAENVGERSRGRFSRVAIWISSRVERSSDQSPFIGRVWLGMFLVYGFSSFPFGLLYDNFHTLHWLPRYPIYGVGIMAYELVAGLIILHGWQIVSGEPFYPWNYSKRGHILHLTYLPYFKYWCLYGVILEYLYVKLIK
jgi:hypothetical protein